jgi:cellulose biosynthesis protein BcsQ
MIKNFKGGVGKTTLTVNLAAAFANKQNPITKEPYKVLVIDCDSHAGASIYMLGIHYWNKVNAKTDSKGKKFLSLESLLTSKKKLTDEYIYPSLQSSEETPIFNPEITEDNKKFERRYESTKQFWKNLYLLPATSDLAHLIENDSKVKINDNLFRELFIPHINEYDFVFIDTGAYFDRLSRNAISISDSILIPFFAEQISINGICHLIAELANFLKKEGLTNKVKIEGFIPMNYDVRTNVVRSNLETFKKTIEDFVRSHPEMKALSKGAIINSKGCSDNIEYRNCMNLNRPVIDTNSTAKVEIEKIREDLLDPSARKKK